MTLVESTGPVASLTMSWMMQPLLKLYMRVDPCVKLTSKRR